MALTGLVIIGRNEGERLRHCLLSVGVPLRHVVYVDSGSTDGSVTLAKKNGAAVVELDTDSPFTAARGRNTGFPCLMGLDPETKYVQFVDGDCELIEGWVETAEKFLQAHPKHAVVCGRLRERYPEVSIYNRLCDIEWNGPVGDIDACGGIFMIRATAFDEVGGMNNNILAGEEPEMCLRLRRKGWLIARIDADMARHDASMTSFRQWWRRAVRSGIAYAQGYVLHGKMDGNYCLRDSLRIWFWALVLPISILLLSLFVAPLYVFILLLYLIMFIKITFRINKRLNNIYHSLLYALFNIIGKFPQLIGQVLFFMNFFYMRFRRAVSMSLSFK